jgi:hypothetical protein
VTGHERRVALKETYLPEGATEADMEELSARSVVVIGSRNAEEEAKTPGTRNRAVLKAPIGYTIIISDGGKSATVIAAGNRPVENVVPVGSLGFATVTLAH